MFKYTKSYCERMKYELKILNILATIFSILLTVIYPIFAIIVKLGNLYVNIAFLALAVIYGIGLLITNIIFNKKNFKEPEQEDLDDNESKNDNEKKTKKILKNIFSISRKLISAIGLVISVYSIYIAATNANGIAIIIATLMIIAWVLTVVVKLIAMILVPRIEILALCMIEDFKPISKKIDFLAIMFGEEHKAIFNISKKPTPIEVKKAMDESKKYYDKNAKNEINSVIKKDIKNLEDFKEKVDLDKDGQLSIEETINYILCNKKMIIDKKEYFVKEFGDEYDHLILDKIIKKGFLKASHELEKLNKYVDEVIISYQKDIDIVKKYLINPNTKIDLENKQKLNEFISSFFTTLIAMQKILYLYNFNQIKQKDKIDTKTMNNLLLAYSVLLDTEDSIEARKALLNITLYKLVQLKDNVSSKFEKIKNHITDFGSKHKKEIEENALKAAEFAAKIGLKFAGKKLGINLNEIDNFM